MCRSQHAESQAQDFQCRKEEARKELSEVTKCINRLNSLLEQQAKNEHACNRAVDNDFKEIEKALIKRKTQLKREVKTRHAEVSKPLNDARKALEKELALINAKFENVSRVSLPVAGQSNAFAKMSDSDFANVCGASIKCGECGSAYQELKKKAGKAGEVDVYEFNTEAGKETKEALKTYGQVCKKECEGGDGEEGDEAAGGEDAEEEEEPADKAEDQQETQVQREDTEYNDQEFDEE